jgi:diguanylate cyclase (GGDEF)-like protein/PAS domain S-box-containing protein
VDPRRWWLLAGVVPAITACAVAASSADLRPLGDLAVAVSGLIVAVLVWVVAAGRGQSRTGWRLLGLAPLPPVVGQVLTHVVEPAAPIDAVVLRWAPTVPGYLVAVVGILLLVEGRRLRAAGLRLAVEAVLFTAACLVVVQFLIVGPLGGWGRLGVDELVVLNAAVFATSATMAAALTLLGVIEAPRQPMALVLLGGAVLLTVGRGLGTSAVLTEMPAAGDGARVLVTAGLWLLALAVLTDPGRGPATGGASPLPGRSTEMGQVLPHLAMLVAVAVTGGVAWSGTRPTVPTIAVLVGCVALAVLHRWITIGEVRAMAARLRRREAYFRSLVRSSSDAVVILDPRLVITSATAALERVLGTGAADLIGRPLLDAVHPDDAAAVAAALPIAGEVEDEPAAGSGLLLLRLMDGGGSWRALEAGVNDLRSDPDVGAVVLHCRDMTERHAREQALLGLAYTDPSTGLPNRAGFLSALEKQLDRGDPVDEESTLMLIELHGLDAARENFGRDTVTTVVSEVGRRLRATVRGEDVVARLGGGGFGVLGHGEPGEAERLASRLLSVVEQPVVTAEGVVDLTAGIGLVTLEGDSVEELFRRADLAVRAAHEEGTGLARRYEPVLGEAAARRERLRTDLQRACAEDQLFLLFQPIIALDQQRITGIEAQLRWRHPELGEIPPTEFLPLADRAGLTGELMRWALRECTSVAVGLTVGGEPVNTGLKVPAGYVATGTLVPDVEHALRASGLPPERLVLQISSSTVTADDERIGLDVATLRMMGVHVAIEGFGGGSSALEHLTRLPLDILKLDRSLITRIDRDPQSRALCESMIGIGRALGFDVVAEGVETPAQLATLRGFGCTFAQGFHVSRPMPLTGLVELLRDDTALWPKLVASR